MRRRKKMKPKLVLVSRGGKNEYEKDGFIVDDADEDDEGE
jgi:hypothetical protein